MSVRPAGRASTTATPVAWLGPALRIVMVKTTTSVTLGVGWSTVLVRTRSAAVTTVDSVLAVLFAGFGSLVWLLVVAVLATVLPAAAPALTRTTSVRVRVAPMGVAPAHVQ